MSDREKILAEVERLRKKNEVFDDKEYAQYELDVSCGYDSALEDILSFINSLPEEPISKDLLSIHPCKVCKIGVKSTGESVSEDLEEASRNYADDEEYGDDVYFAIKAAFKSGAKWQMHNTWHKPYEKPEANISGLIVIYKDKTLGFINMDDVNEKLGLDIVSDGWAYLKDILPDNEDE